jgi:RNA polymerase sigma-70 factor, ECF subfamily
MTSLEQSAVELRSMLHRFVAGRVPAQDVDDLLQDVFVRMQRGLDGVRDGERLNAWVYQIARNAIADHFRKPVARRELPTADLAALPLAAEADDADEVPGDLTGAVMRFLHQLPDADREAIELTDLQGLTQAEAARRLGLSIPGMKSRVQRARAKLRELLDDCCRIELDVRGRIVGCEPREQPDCCDEPTS